MSHTCKLCDNNYHFNFIKTQLLSTLYLLQQFNISYLKYYLQISKYHTLKF